MISDKKLALKLAQRDTDLQHCSFHPKIGRPPTVPKPPLADRQKQSPLQTATVSSPVSGVKLAKITDEFFFSSLRSSPPPEASSRPARRKKTEKVLGYSKLKCQNKIFTCSVLVSMLLPQTPLNDEFLLVPYSADLVEPYHRLFTDEILKLTATESMTLEEERELQKSWESDPEKFIAILKHQPTNQIIGDINLFLVDDYQDEHSSAAALRSPTTGEVNLMVRDDFRNRGLGGLLVQFISDFAKKELKLKSLVAKIQTENSPSLRLFERLGFKFEKEVKAFGEIHLRLVL